MKALAGFLSAMVWLSATGTAFGQTLIAQSDDSASPPAVTEVQPAASDAPAATEELKQEEKALEVSAPTAANEDTAKGSESKRKKRGHKIRKHSNNSGNGGT